MIASTLSFVVRAITVSTMFLIVGVSWSIVEGLMRDRRNGRRVRPAPAWANITFLGGMAFVLAGVAIGNWQHLDYPISLANWVIAVGELLLAVGTGGLFWSYNRGRSGVDEREPPAG